MATADLDAAIARMAPLVKAAAEENERRRQLSGNVLEAIYDAGLFRLWVPDSLGGAELPLPASLRIFEQVSYADGATGWCVMIGAGAGLFAGFMEPGAARQVFGGRTDVVAGSGSPSGLARPVDGGYLATGRWKYASGSPHATWFTANCLVEGAQNSAGDPLIRAIAAPRADVQVIDTWDVHGMRATASHDIAVADLFIPAERTFSVFDDSPVEPGPLYRFPFVAIAALSFAPVAIGIARRALDEFAALAREKVPSGATQKLGELPVARARYAQASAIVEAARLLLYDTAEAQWDDIAKGGSPESLDLSASQRAAAHAARASAQAIDLLYEVAGMSVLYNGSALGRCWRDIHALTQNRAVSALRWEEAAAPRPSLSS